jgi:glucose-1-phosphate adenylyltransferase
MELLLDPPPFDLNNHDFPIYSNNSNTIPQVIGKDAEVKNSLICDGCIIEGKVVNSIISKNVSVGKDACVENSIIMHNATINSGVKVINAVVSEDMIVTQGVLKGNIAKKAGDGVNLLYSSKAE